MTFMIWLRLKTSSCRILVFTLFSSIFAVFMVKKLELKMPTIRWQKYMFCACACVFVRRVLIQFWRYRVEVSDWLRQWNCRVKFLYNICTRIYLCVCDSGFSRRPEWGSFLGTDTPNSEFASVFSSSNSQILLFFTDESLELYFSLWIAWINKTLMFF